MRPRARRCLGLALAAALAACGPGAVGDDDDEAGTDGGRPGGADARPGRPDSGGPPRPDATPPAVDEPAGLEGITAAHDAVRASVGVGPMTWSPSLAATAQAWAEECVDATAPAGLIDHNPDRSDDHPYYVGENIYGSGGVASPTTAVERWAAEAADYDYASNTCAPGAVCGHYTQVVWATSVELGCGLHTCPGLTYGSTIVCNYGPGGNDGGRPY